LLDKVSPFHIPEYGIMIMNLRPQDIVVVLKMVRGTSFTPLYKNVPEASKRDPKLYELLALVDTIRDGRARESEIAIRELTARIDAA
jgi:hypothetical protein